MLEMFTDADPMREDYFRLPADGWMANNSDAHRAQEGKVDIDNQIIEMFRARGMMIESGSQFSARGQIAQLLDVVKPIIAERDEALAKLAALEKQEPYITLHAEKGDYRIEWHNPWTLSEGSQSFYIRTVNAEKPARITEQDAREIAISVMRYCHQNSTWYPDVWIEDCGRELLNKLNADREQVPEVAVLDGFREIVEAVAHIGVDFGYGNFVLSQEHIEKARAILEAGPSHSQHSAE